MFTDCVKIRRKTLDIITRNIFSFVLFYSIDYSLQKATKRL